MVAVTVAETLVTQVNTEWGSSSVNIGLVLCVTTRITTESKYWDFACGCSYSGIL